MHAVAMQLHALHLLLAFDVESKGFFQLLPPPHSATFCVVESFLLENVKKSERSKWKLGDKQSGKGKLFQFATFLQEKKLNAKT